MTETPAPDALLAQLDEAEALIVTLRNRCATLNLEVRNRDARIEALESAPD